MSKRWALLLGAGFLVLYVAQGLAYIEANSQTFDEANHLASGYSYLMTGDFRLNSEHPPFVKMVWAVPVYFMYRPPFTPEAKEWENADAWGIGRHFLYESTVPADDLLRTARRTNLALGALLVTLIGWWAYRLWGPTAAVTALGLAAFCPNLVAHGCNLSTDLGITLFTALFAYLLWEYARAPSSRLLIFLGIALGLALGTKFSAIFLVPILGLTVLIHGVAGGRFPFPGTVGPAPANWRERLAEAFGPIVRIGVLAGLTLVAVYFGVGFPTWAMGLRYQIARVGSSESFYFLGEISSHGWLAYFPVALLIKTPVGTLVLAAVGLGTLLIAVKRATRTAFFDAIFLLVPPAFYLAMMMHARVNLGLRIILPVVPFLLVVAGRAATLPRWLAPTVAGLGVALAAWSSLSVAPHQLAYFNELVGGPAEGHRYLVDSNLDWGQGLKELHAYLETQGNPPIYLAYFGTAPPSAYGIKCQHLPEYPPLGSPFCTNSNEPKIEVPPDRPRLLLAISITLRQGIHLPEPNPYAWLERRKPVAIIGDSLWVYDLTDDADGRRHLTSLTTGH